MKKVINNLNPMLIISNLAPHDLEKEKLPCGNFSK
jgi:hypothetical protein